MVVGLYMCTVALHLYSCPGRHCNIQSSSNMIQDDFTHNFISFGYERVVNVLVTISSKHLIYEDTLGEEQNSVKYIAIFISNFSPN